MRKPNLDKIIAENLDKTKGAPSLGPGRLPKDGWLNQYIDGGIFLSDRAKATQFGQYKSGGLTANKAREILHDKEVHGHPLTEKQRRFFGAKAKGNTMKYADGANVLYVNPNDPEGMRKYLAYQDSSDLYNKFNLPGRKVYFNTPIEKNEDYRMYVDILHYSPEEAKKKILKLNAEDKKWMLKKYGEESIGYNMNKFDNRSSRHYPVFKKPVQEVRLLPQNNTITSKTLGQFHKTLKTLVDIDPIKRIEPKVLTPSISSKDLQLQPGLTNQGEYIISTSDGAYRVPNKTMFDAITKNANYVDSHENEYNKTAGATVGMSEENWNRFSPYLQKIGSKKYGGDASRWMLTNPNHISTYFPKEAYGGDPSIPDLQEGNWLSRYDIGGDTETTWDQYRTKLNKTQEAGFNKWKANLPQRLQYDKDYDLRGFYKKYGKEPMPKEGEFHLTDEFKLPNHPTFSSESKYYNPNTQYLGGNWINTGAEFIYAPNSDLKKRIVESVRPEDIRRNFMNIGRAGVSRSSFSWPTNYDPYSKKQGGLVKASNGGIGGVSEYTKNLPSEVRNKYLTPMSESTAVLNKNADYLKFLTEKEMYDKNLQRVNEAVKFLSDYQKSPMYQKLYSTSVASDKEKGKAPYPVQTNFNKVKFGSREKINRGDSLGNLEGLTFYSNRSFDQPNVDILNTDAHLKFSTTPIHEYSHVFDRSGLSIPKSDIELMKKYQKIGDDFGKYVADPTETLARLRTAKFLGKTQNIYDPFKEKINKDQYIKLRNLMGDDFQNPLLQLEYIYTPDQIIDMMNRISQNKSSNQSSELPLSSNYDLSSYPTASSGGLIKAKNGRTNLTTEQQNNLFLRLPTTNPKFTLDPRNPMVWKSEAQVAAEKKQWEEHQREKEEEQQKKINYSLAADKALANQNTPFTLPNGVTKTYNQMDPREKAYVNGQALYTQFRAYNKPNIFDDTFNLLNTGLGRMAGNLGTAAYQAKQENSWKPYVTAIGEPIVTGLLSGLGEEESTTSPISKGIKSKAINLSKDVVKSTNKAFNPLELVSRNVGEKAKDLGIDKTKEFLTDAIRGEEKKNIGMKFISGATNSIPKKYGGATKGWLNKYI